MSEVIEQFIQQVHTPAQKECAACGVKVDKRWNVYQFSRNKEDKSMKPIGWKYPEWICHTCFDRDGNKPRFVHRIEHKKVSAVKL